MMCAMMSATRCTCASTVWRPSASSRCTFATSRRRCCFVHVQQFGDARDLAVVRRPHIRCNPGGHHHGLDLAADAHQPAGVQQPQPARHKLRHYARALWPARPSPLRTTRDRRPSARPAAAALSSCCRGAVVRRPGLSAPASPPAGRQRHPGSSARTLPAAACRCAAQLLLLPALSPVTPASAATLASFCVLSQFSIARRGNRHWLPTFTAGTRPSSAMR